MWAQLVELLQTGVAEADAIAWERAIIDATIVPAKWDGGIGKSPADRRRRAPNSTSATAAASR